MNIRGVSGPGGRPIPMGQHAETHVAVATSRSTVAPVDIAPRRDAGLFSCLTRPISVSRFMDALNEALESVQRDG